jgi:hypothetical protein
MKAGRNSPIGKVAFRRSPSSPTPREGRTRIGTDEAWRKNTASTVFAASIPSEIR